MILNNYYHRDQCINYSNVFTSSNMLRVVITMCIINSQTLYVIVVLFFSPPAFSGIHHTGSHLTAPLCQAALNLGLFGPMSPPTIRSPQDPGTYLRSSSHCRSPSQWKLQSCDYNLVSVFSRSLWPFSRLILKLRRQHILLWRSHCRNDKYV